MWKGKDDQDAEDLAVPAVPIYIQEKIDPRAIIENLMVTTPGRASPNQSGSYSQTSTASRAWTRWTRVESPTNTRATGQNRMILGDSRCGS